MLSRVSSAYITQAVVNTVDNTVVNPAMYIMHIMILHIKLKVFF